MEQWRDSIADADDGGGRKSKATRGGGTGWSRGVEQKDVGVGKGEHVVQHDEEQSRCGVEQAKVQRMAGRIGTWWRCNNRKAFRVSGGDLQERGGADSDKGLRQCSCA
jgi:hypothetical protein